MDILPAIDLREGRCVRLLQGDYSREITYSDDPSAVARQFEQAGAKWIHVVDLDGAREGVLVNRKPITEIVRQTGLSVEVGGGIRDDQTVRALFEAGVRRVVIGTRALEDWPWFERVVHEPANEGRIALGLDAREGRLAARGWLEQTDRTAVELAEMVAGWPLAAIIYTDIARDGMLLGPNIEAIRALASASKVPVIASGGVTDMNDVRMLAEMPLAGMIIGRAIYEGQIDLKEAVDYVQTMKDG